MPARPSRFRVELPTILLTLAIYGGWTLLTLFWQALPLPLVVMAGAWLVAWHGSLQHEVMHGHPTRRRWLNDAIGWVPLNLWLPYVLYKSAHLRHHNDEALTDPIEDPESAYLTAAVWDRIGPAGRLLARFNNTLVGRLSLGPLVMIGGFLAGEAAVVLGGDRRRRRIWGVHLAGVALVLAWVILVCGMPPALYLLGFVYAGGALTRLRSFAEHRWAEREEERTAIVENASVFGLLFLNNNLHVLHHLRPQVPWYRLPALYRAERAALLRRNGGLVYDGYRDVLRRYFLSAHHKPVHPLQPALGRPAEAAAARSASSGPSRGADLAGLEGAQAS